MIINNKIRIRITKKNHKHYKKKGKVSDYIMVYPNELMKTSKSLVCVECDNCRTKEKIEYRRILTKRYDIGYFCKYCRLDINNIIFQDYTKTINYILETNDIYTNKGWINIKDISINDLVYVYNTKFELSAIKNIINKEFNSYQNIKSKYIDFNFNNEHNFLLKNRNDIIDIKKISETNGKDHLFFSFNKNINTDIEYFHLNDYSIPMNNWCKFMGIYLSDGYSLSSKDLNKIIITQKKTHIIILMRELLNDLPFIYKEYIQKDGTIDFTIIDKTLYEYLFQFGDSSNKYIPNNIKETGLHNINTFIDYLLMGDGKSRIVNGKLYRELYTTSIQLKNDLEHLFYLIGSGCNINKQLSKDKLDVTDVFIISESNKKGRYLDTRYVKLNNIESMITGYLIQTNIDGYILLKSNNNCVFFSI